MKYTAWLVCWNIQTIYISLPSPCSLLVQLVVFDWQHKTHVYWVYRWNTVVTVLLHVTSLTCICKLPIWNFCVVHQHAMEQHLHKSTPQKYLKLGVCFYRNLTNLGDGVSHKAGFGHGWTTLWSHEYLPPHGHQGNPATLNTWGDLMLRRHPPHHRV